MNELRIDADYLIRELPTDEFSRLVDEPHRQFFGEASLVFPFRQFMTSEMSEAAKALSAKMGTPERINLGLFHKERFVGWSYGFQESAESFYMCNSAVFPEYRERGLYTRLMNAMVDETTRRGYQRIYSRHRATNNAVLIPKLKAGFVITNLEISDIFGVMIHLTYFPHPIRRKVMDFRVGQIKPDDELKSAFKI